MEYEISGRMQSVKGSAIREIFKHASSPDIISLAGGNPAPELFPNEELATIAKDLLENQPVLALQYGVTEGHLPLREAVRTRLERLDGISREGDDLIIVSGGQQGIELSAKILLNEGDTVIVEEPSFIGATNAFRSYGARLAGVPVEDDGMNIEALRRVISENKNVKLIYTIPTFQNPTGVTMSNEKRRLVYEIARENGILILEDNPYGELAFDGVRQKTIKSMDTDGIVIYSSSFSKILAPALRLGYVVADKALIGKMVIAKQVSDVHTAMLTQLLATEYLKRYDLDSAIVKMRENYAAKCKAMLAAMEEYFPKGIYYTRPRGGLFIWCDLGHGIDTAELAKKAIAQKVAYVPGNTFMVDMDKPCSALRLNYSTMSAERITEGIKRLGEVFTKAISEK